MEHRLLEYFIAVGEDLHFTRAAERLGISQPTLSHQIRLLEQELGTALISRIGKKNYLTQAGSILLEHARRVVTKWSRPNWKSAKSAACNGATSALVAPATTCWKIS
ncbi:hypothetical protein HMSSN139_36660 [Paenibacillus sp. HMSSN-139]|nr:hypothetical protein HMSSN139_36660 [Paenibacillus sp. HMSSN-139]